MKLWKWWILVVAIVSGPWFGVTLRPQWSRVTWIPFRGREDKASDMIGNALLWMPFGWSFLSGRRPGSGLAAAVGVAALVSFGAEASQLFFIARDPSLTDVVMGVCGAATGGAAAILARHASARASIAGPR
ncbi:MAG TPA: VanZ family protein [Vicinamibacterales bacterium]